MAEIINLIIALQNLGIDFTVNKLYDGYQVDCGDWDAIWHKYSYGYEKGLLEIYGSIVPNGDVTGYLTADAIVKMLG